MFCSNCGKELPSDAKFCYNCGKPTGQSSEQSSNTQRQKEFIGKVNKCPNCGTELRTFDVVCPTCGYEINGRKSVSSAEKFKKEYDELVHSQNQVKKTHFNSIRILTEQSEEQARFIKNYAVPNTIEDICEFFFLSIASIDDNVYKKAKNYLYMFITPNSEIKRLKALLPITEAWINKMYQMRQKAAISFKNDPKFQEIDQTFKAKINSLGLKESSF